ncbi:MAG: 50S ribosomal protein L10, partial [Candidatus Omnitrophica bacterium]|nr:50S ribosomal protein L10 [Candidatus Omnitrophota bacterium]
IKDIYKSSKGFLVVKYSGVSSPDMSILRKSLKGTGVDMLVVKNSIARRAMKDLGLEQLVPTVETPCGMIFFRDEPVEASKVLCSFNKEKEKLVFAGGYLNEKLLAKEDIVAMSKLPSREVLLTKVVCTLNGPISGLAIVLNQVLKKFVVCLDQVKQKRTVN